MTDTIRKAFENWSTDWIEQDSPSMKADLLERNGDTYAHALQRVRWRVWKASWEAALAAPQPKGLFVDMIAEHGLEFGEDMPEPQPVKQAPLKSFQQLEYKVGWQRYEKVRKLNVHQFSELFQRGLKGERFDEMVDALEGEKP